MTFRQVVKSWAAASVTWCRLLAPCFLSIADEIALLACPNKRGFIRAEALPCVVGRFREHLLFLTLKHPSYFAKYSQIGRFFSLPNYASNYLHKRVFTDANIRNIKLAPEHDSNLWLQLDKGTIKDAGRKLWLNGQISGLHDFMGNWTSLAQPLKPNLFFATSSSNLANLCPFKSSAGILLCNIFWSLFRFQVLMYSF